MRLGFDAYTIAHRGLSAPECLRFALDRGLDGLQLLEPSSIDRALDPETLRAFRREADFLGLHLEVGLPCPNPIRRSRALGRAVSAAEHALDLARHIEAMTALECPHARAYLGDRHDRFRTDVAWADQVAATEDVLRRLRPLLLDRGLRIALETHADLTADELLGLIDRVGSDVLGVTLDTGNLAMRLDEPLRAVERLAPLVLMTHVKDCVLAFTPRGLAWQARPIGAGVLPIPDILAALVAWNPSLNLSIELHPRTYDLPIFDVGWLAHFPSLRAADLSGVVRLAYLSEQKFAESPDERTEAVEAIPWEDRDLEWLARSVGYLRPVVSLLSSL